MKKFALFILVFLLSCANNVVPAPTEVISAINEAISLKIPIYTEGLKIDGNKEIDFDPAMNADPELNADPAMRSMRITIQRYSAQLEVKADVIIFSEKSMSGHGGTIIIPLNRLKSLVMATETKIPYQGKLITGSEFDNLTEEQRKELRNNIDNGSIKIKTEKTKLTLYFQ